MTPQRRSTTRRLRRCRPASRSWSSTDYALRQRDPTAAFADNCRQRRLSENDRAKWRRAGESGDSSRRRRHSPVLDRLTSRRSSMPAVHGSVVVRQSGRWFDSGWCPGSCSVGNTMSIDVVRRHESSPRFGVESAGPVLPGQTGRFAGSMFARVTP